jgi:hypothetical protein
MGALVPFTRALGLAPRPRSALPKRPRQLDLVLDDVRLRGMTTAQRKAALKTLAQLVLEASGAVIKEAGDDDE